MKTSIVALVVVLTGATAFAPQHGGRSTFPRRFMSASPDLEVETMTTTTTPTSSTAPPAATTPTASFTPEFQAAYDQAESTLSAAISQPQLLTPLLHFTKEYFSANQAGFLQTQNPLNAPDATAKRILSGIKLGLTYGMGESKYLFGATHKAIRDLNGVDFYQFGCDFFRPVISGCVVQGRHHLQQAMEQLAAGDNVVFLANHQSEADPQVMSVCLEQAGFPDAAAGLTYVAGHKVTTDALAIPFSMGRNLICIHSKKHIDTDPDTKPMKQRQNLNAMSDMLGLLKQGGTALWVAPSGGRDRRDLTTGKVPIAKFDSKTIDMFRLMGNKSKKATHYYPLAMVSYDLCPPPDYVEAGTGEQRNVRFTGVGISCGEELISEGGLEHRHEFCEEAELRTRLDYEALLKEMGMYQ
jgi:glycerol-3-phosphate O-acyltransferase